MQEISVNLNQLESEIIILTQQAQKMALHYICEIGGRLAAAKELVGHGNWETWLADNVHYKQSTAEGYMKVYREFGEFQKSMFESDNSKYETLPYTKLLALSALNEDERDELSENIDVEAVSTRELERLVKQYKEEKAEAEDKRDELLNETDRLCKVIEKANAEIEGFKAALSAQDEQETIDADGIRESVKAEYEAKIRKAVEAKKKAETAKKELEERIEQEKKTAAEKAAGDATVKANKAAEKDISALKNEVRELERKLGAASGGTLPTINVYFGEIQNYIVKMAESFKILKQENNDTYNKLSAGVKQKLHGIIDTI